MPSGDGPVMITVLATDGATTIDRRSGEPVGLPVAISELAANGLGSALPALLNGACRDDLLSVDGKSIALRITGSTSAALAGEPLGVELCGESAIDLAAGEHVVRGATGTGFAVDRVVLHNELATQLAPPAAAVNVAVSASDDERNVTVAPCPAGCWLIFGEGFNDGWSASSPELGPLANTGMVDGGFNGWWLEPHDDVVHVRLEWAAQRPVDIALWISGLAALGCVALAGWPFVRRRFAGPTSSDAGLTINPELSAATFSWWPPDRVTKRAAVAWALGTVGIAWMLVGPLGAIGACAVTATTCGWLRRPQLNAGAGVAGAAVSSLYVLIQAVRLRPSAGSAFLAAVSDAHQPFVLAVVLIAAGSLAAVSTSQVASRSCQTGRGSPESASL